MKTIRQLMMCIMLIGLVLSIQAFPAFAQGQSLTKDGYLGVLLAQDTGDEEAPASQPSTPTLFPLPGAEIYGGVADPGSGTAQARIESVAGGILNNARVILSSVAIFMIVYAGFRMVIGWGKEDVYNKQRLNILYSIIGLALVAMAGELAQIFSLNDGGFVRDPNQILRTANLFNQQTQIIIVFIKYIIGAIAILMIVRNGYRMIAMSTSEENLAQDKKNLMYGAIGLFLVIISDTVINNVFYQLDLSRYPGTGGAQPSFSAQAGVSEIVGITNFAVSVLGPLAVLVLVGGGIMYITAAGQEDRMQKAKRLIISALAGIIIIYGAFAIVSTFIVGRFE